MTKFVLLFSLIAFSGFVTAAPNWFSPAAAGKCNVDDCQLPECRCFGVTPSLEKDQLPQIVLISSDDAVNKKNFEELYEPLYFGRKNPNGCQIGVTFFVPHEYTDYAKVHELYANGFEIGVNSITKNSSAEYWANASEEVLQKEFEGQKQIIQQFAQIEDEAAIQGGRIPLLQINGDKTYSGLQNSRLSYDNTWTTKNKKVWPYTLDYKSEQPCDIGECPKEEHKGFWIVPISNWLDAKDTPCATVSGCSNLPKDDANEIYDWILKNYEKNHERKLPFNMILNSDMFGRLKEFKTAYVRFLDYLQEQSDVYIINQSAAIEWVKDPKAVDDIEVFRCEDEKEHDDGLELVCPLKTSNGEERYMTIYGSNCPKSYPWLDNPAGN